MFEYGIHTFLKPIVRKLAKPVGGATQKVTKSISLVEIANAFAAGAREPSVCSSGEFSAQRSEARRSEPPRQLPRA
jgi:hypothetical protein